jgi:hypothetical protein
MNEESEPLISTAPPPRYDEHPPQFGNVPPAPLPTQNPQVVRVVYVDASGVEVNQPQAGGLDSFYVQLIFAIAVTLCCILPLGLVAIALALAAYSRSMHGNPDQGRKLGRASIGVSIASVVIGIILIAVLVGIGVFRNGHHD